MSANHPERPRTTDTVTNTTELSKRIGSQGSIKLGRNDEFTVTVRVTDCKTVWGNLRFQVQPIAGSGSAWVNADSLTFTDEATQ